MKRIFAAILFLIALLAFVPSGYAANGYGATALTGGTAGCLDAINGATLTDGDKAFVTTTTQFYVYNLDASSATAESSPTVISPDSSAGDKRWELVYIVTNGKGIDEGRYAADAEASDTYVITLSPAPAAYYTGMQIYFTANTANTGAATLNVNALGAKTIKKHHDQDLTNGDIEAAQLVLVVYDGTNFQMQSQVGAVTGTGSTVKSAAPTFTGQATIPTINLTDGQIAFPATAVPSADPNTMDDYEEGEFGTAAANGILKAATGSITCANVYTCTYTKIGRQVSISGYVVVSAVSGQSGNTNIVLPFAVGTGNSFGGVGSVQTDGIDFAGNYLSLRANIGAASALFIATADNGAAVALDAAGATAADELGVGITYFTD